MSKGQSRWSRWTAVFAVAVGMSLVASAWARDAKGKTQDATNAVAEVSVQGEIPAITARLQEVEAQLSKVENRFEDYRRSQDDTLKEMLVQWSGMLIAPIREQFNENAQKEFETFRKQSQTILDSVSEKNDQKGRTGNEGKNGEVECWYKNAMLWVAIIFSIIILVVFCFLYGLSRKKQTIENSTLYCYEMGLLVIVILLISIGSYHLLSRIIDFGASGNSIRAITLVDYNQAVIQAYEQLSNELGRWAALFSILGVFFGLVLPVGGHLLQIKAVKNEEERIKKLIDKAIDDARKELKGLINVKAIELSNEFDDMSGKFNDKLKELDAKTLKMAWHNSVHAKMTILDLAYKVKKEWENNQIGDVSGNGLLAFCEVLDDCVASLGDEDELRKAGLLILDVFDRLKHSESGRKYWNEFAQKVAKKCSEFNDFNFHFTKDLLGDNDYARWKELCKELGIKGIK